MTGPMPDDELLTLAQHRFEQADRDDATGEDCRELRDIFPDVLQRLREKVELVRDLGGFDAAIIAHPKGWETQAAVAGDKANLNQMQISLLEL